ncbi:hypothetical protein Droror1_Dr00006850 [Drosera rotundifolia]
MSSLLSRTLLLSFMVHRQLPAQKSILHQDSIVLFPSRNKGITRYYEIASRKQNISRLASHFKKYEHFAAVISIQNVCLLLQHVQWKQKTPDLQNFLFQLQKRKHYYTQFTQHEDLRLRCQILFWPHFLGSLLCFHLHPHFISSSSPKSWLGHS